ncbi:alpha/beta fold hydrolase [Planomonospora sp. ID82291]|uniref:alpha/beta fold hydrolase n=1 Tax=Planomonospora sp. ID82291 TaxID=2738136 RepID=UPI0018C3DF7F|nr:alpha/beta fold hydrolase [Planomonospora sp. ID82291]MBG0816478.1 alpha/beta fold hydrolase [Planomonospora sp. ID82291]
MIDVAGTEVHYLSAGEDQGGPTHLLIHPMAASASMWMDAIAELGAHAPVIAPDLPGSVFGHTGSPHPRASTAGPSARFLRAFTGRMGLEATVTHGWSMGGLVAVHFAACTPERVDRLVLACPALPGPLAPDEVVFWRVAGRPLLVVGPGLLRGALRVAGRRIIDAKLRAYADPGAWSGSVVGDDLERLSPEMLALLGDELRATDPRRLGDAVAAFTSVISALYVSRSTVHRMIDRLGAPTLLLTGAQDKLITAATAGDLVARRPDWAYRAFPSAGHLLPLSNTRDYVATVTDWLNRSGGGR